MESVTRFWSHEAQNIRCVRESDFDRVSAERGALQARVNELLEDFQELSEQSERRGRQASEFEDRMGELQIENGKLRDRINLLSDAGEHVESHLDSQADILRIERDDLQQRLTVQDQRVDELETQVHSLEQRRQAEQQAREAAERRVEELGEQLALEKEVSLALNGKLKSLQATVRKQMGLPDSAADPRQNLIDFITLHKEGEKSGWDVEQNAHEESALSPTAEAESHE